MSLIYTNASGDTRKRLEALKPCCLCIFHNHKFESYEQYKELHDGQGMHGCALMPGWRQNKPDCQYFVISKDVHIGEEM